MKITYNDLDGSAPVVAVLNGEFRLFDGRTETVPVDLEAEILARLGGNPWFEIEVEEAASAPAAPVDEKEQVIADLAALGITADKRKSLATLKADLEAALADA